MQKPTYTNTSLHEALNKKFPKNGICENCNNRSEVYALIHGKEYSLNREDYLELCKACHASYDIHAEWSTIDCNCKDKRVRYNHGSAYNLIEREDAELKICHYSLCDNQFWTTLSNKIYCSKRCGVSAFRERKGLSSPVYEGRVCAKENCGNIIESNQKVTVKYCSNSCRQKVYNDRNKEKIKEEYAIISEQRKKIKDLKKAEEYSNKVADQFLQEMLKND